MKQAISLRLSWTKNYRSRSLVRTRSIARLHGKRDRIFCGMFVIALCSEGGAGSRIRTDDLLITNQLLYP